MHNIVQHLSRFVFRVLLFYWICFVFPFPLDALGMSFQLTEPKNQPEWLKVPREYYFTSMGWIQTQKTKVCQWVGPHVFDKPVIIQMTGSGDTMRSYVGCFCAGVIAIVLALLWTQLVLLLRYSSIFWNADDWLHRAVRVLVRFFLVQMLFGYGFAKVFPNQFPEPTYRLDQSFGDLSPMGLLWSFMGFSPAYQMFTGWVEVLAGLMLITRRTTMLGALLTVAAMTQIFLLNMCYDVPVKLYSFHYLIMGLFLVAPDLPRFLNVLVLGKGTEAKAFPPFLGRRWVDWIVLVIRTLFVGLLLWFNIQQNYVRWDANHGGPTPPISGRWEAISVQIDGKNAEKEDAVNWKSLDLRFKGAMIIVSPNPPALRFKVVWKPDEQQLTLFKFTDMTWATTFKYALPAEDQLILTGEFDGRKLIARFKQTPQKKYTLTNRGFHWIQERPFN